MEIVKKELRARDYAADLLDGRVALSGVPEHLREMALSMIGLSIHNLAREVLDSATREQRRRALDGIPAGIRLLVEDEARRIFDSAKSK